MISEKIKSRKCASHLKQKISCKSPYFLQKAFAVPHKGKIRTVESFSLLGERNLSLWLTILVNYFSALVLQLGNLNIRFWVFWMRSEGLGVTWWSVGCRLGWQKTKPLCLSFWEELHVSYALSFLPGCAGVILFSTATCSNAVNSEIIPFCLFLYH